MSQLIELSEILIFVLLFCVTTAVQSAVLGTVKEQLNDSEKAAVELGSWV